MDNKEIECVFCKRSGGPYCSECDRDIEFSYKLICIIDEHLSTHKKPIASKIAIAILEEFNINER